MMWTHWFSDRNVAHALQMHLIAPTSARVFLFFLQIMKIHEEKFFILYCNFIRIRSPENVSATMQPTSRQFAFGNTCRTFDSFSAPNVVFGVIICCCAFLSLVQLSDTSTHMNLQTNVWDKTISFPRFWLNLSNCIHSRSFWIFLYTFYYYWCKTKCKHEINSTEICESWW